MNAVIIQNFVQLILNQTGLQIREQDQKDFSNKIYSRMKFLKLNTPEQYYQLLSNTLNNQRISFVESSKNEWKELILLLTIGETYFFRDQGQLTLLKNRILPELIKIKINCCEAREQKPSLRIWSAGCSSGEEAYSLAILVKELIPDLNEWNILILGTDINQESIEKAKQGIYDSWSFRQMDSQLKKQYFHQHKMRWQVAESIHKMVKFRTGNLFQEAFPSQTSDIYNMDLIICRNVFIYFNSQAIATVVEKFERTLIPSGYLIVGHTELHGQNIGKLQPRVFSESIVYQRSQNPQIEPLPIVNLPQFKTLPKTPVSNLKINNINQKKPAHSLTNPKNIPLLSTQKLQQSPIKEHLNESTERTALSLAKTLLHSGNYTSAIQAAKQIVQHHQHFEASCLIAQAWANLGDYVQAIHWCQQAIKLNELSEKPYYILAHIAEEKADFEQTKILFKKIIYLAPSSISAYLELSSIYEREGAHNRAKKMLETALGLLKVLPSNFVIESYAQMKAGKLMLEVKKSLENYK